MVVKRAGRLECGKGGFWANTGVHTGRPAFRRPWACGLKFYASENVTLTFSRANGDDAGVRPAAWWPLASDFAFLVTATDWPLRRSTCALRYEELGTSLARCPLVVDRTS
jgi:hypothetical protein